MKLKLTPLTIFLMLLTVLFISIFFLNKSSEGFIAYHENTPALNQLYITEYSSSNMVYKLYDSIFYDSLNGNIIELFGTPFSNSDNNSKGTNEVDLVGSSLTDIVLMSRSSSRDAPMIINHYDLNVDQSMVKRSMTNSYNYSITPNNENFNSIPNIKYDYQVLYISWGNDTIIHIYDCTITNNVNIGTYLFRQSYDPMHYMYSGNLTNRIGNYIIDNDPNNNSYVKEPLYDSNKQNSLFQLSKNVLFDTSCRYLIVRNNEGITVYDGTLASDQVTPNEITNVTNTPKDIERGNFSKFQVLYISDIGGNNFVLYLPIPSTTKTMVAIICMDPTVPGYLTVKNVMTFNQDSSNGLDGSTLESPPQEPNKSTKEECNRSTKEESSMKKNPHEKNETECPKKSKIIDDYDYPYTEDDVEKKVVPSLDTIISNYYSKYWNKNLPANSSSGERHYSNDFLLKTQVIPPICPVCPKSSNVSCSNCGGNGGAGLRQDISNVDVIPPDVTPPEVTPPDVSYNRPPTQPVPVQSHPQISVDDAYNHSPHEEPTFEKRNIPEGTPDKYSYHGALPEKESNSFLPWTSDFSKFGR